MIVSKKTGDDYDKANEDLFARHLESTQKIFLKNVFKAPPGYYLDSWTYELSHLSVKILVANIF